ncbi:MAG TPA: hypothetical protein DCY85_04565 [Firmicutes bacterium]|mgnify:FL=1|nr:hypothetical protein [Bacillota bacterium]HBE05743.1 hypothetical protein [Bacillota bacterium]
MRREPLGRRLITCLIVALTIMGLSCIHVSAVLLKLGAKGPLVYQAQDWLYILDYLKVVPDGNFGPVTEGAVKSFQEDTGLEQDGIVGNDTWVKLEQAAQKQINSSYTVKEGDSLEAIAKRFSLAPEELAEYNQLIDLTLVPGQTLALPPRSDISRGGNYLELAPWEEVHCFYKDYGVARIIDVQTGLSFLVQRRGGTKHADAEPLTKQDTAAMKQIYGGKWKWDRRPVIFEYQGRWIAASINGMPHGGERINDNNFAGHFCIHFLGSKLHSSGKQDPVHQATVLKAAAYGR